jgi:hypothetical protein
VPLSFPKPFLNALMRERCHCETRMGNAKAAFFVGKNGRGCFDGIALELRARGRPRTFEPVL